MAWTPPGASISQAQDEPWTWIARSKHANNHEVAVYTFYAPSVGLTSRSRLAASYGQSSLNRLADETGGKAFFQGSSGFVTFDSYFENLKRTLNEHARAS